MRALLGRGGHEPKGRSYPFEGEDLERLRDADYVRWETPDINGISKGKTMTKAAVKANPMEGISLYSGVLAFGANSELNLMPEVLANNHADCFAVARPAEVSVSGGDLPAVAPVPWSGGGKHKVVSVMCDTKWKDGEDNWQAANPRVVARRQLQKLKGMGYSFKSACEYEFRVFDRKTMEPISKGTDIFNTLVNAEFEDLMFEIEAGMRACGVGLETLQNEFGSAQFELTLRPYSGLDAADAAFRFRHGVKEMCQKKGLLASFMTKPLQDETSNSCHFNHSLQPLSDAAPGFKYGEGQLNDVARHWLGGLMKHGPALTALCAPTVNCYRRLHQPWAPSHTNWGLENRFMMVRVKQEDDGGCYFENRLGCGSSNPYLVLAATVAAGLDGLQNKLEPPAADSSEGTLLPKSLEEAIAALEADEYMVNALGEGFISWFKLVKKAEMEAVDKCDPSGNYLTDFNSAELQKEVEVYSRFL